MRERKSDALHTLTQFSCCGQAFTRGNKSEQWKQESHNHTNTYSPH